MSETKNEIQAPQLLNAAEAAAWCGRAFDNALLDTLPAGVDPCGERGEFHTLSYGGPLFRQALALRRGESALRDGRFQYTDFLLADATH